MTHRVKAGLLLGWAALIAKLLLTGQMAKYMAPALDPLTALAALVLAAMGIVELLGGSHEEHRDHAPADATEQTLTIALVILPLALGFLVAPRALGASALGDRVTDLILAYAPGSARDLDAAPPATRPIDDTADLLAYLRQAGANGINQRVRATGLAAFGTDLAAGELALLRYSIAHCVADAQPLALLVVAPTNTAVAADQWIEVEGVLAAREKDGRQLVTIAAERIRPIPEPQNPYLGARF
jgi:uncharacterized repeat protein (TIGR03943 family)